MNRARICRRDIADELVAQNATLARIGRRFSIFVGGWITDNVRLERGREAELLRNGQENGLRSRGLVHPEHALCLAELCPDEMGAS